MGLHEIPVATGVPVSASHASSGLPVATPVQGSANVSASVPRSADANENIPMQPRQIRRIYEPDVVLVNLPIPSGVPPGGRYVEVAFLGQARGSAACSRVCSRHHWRCAYRSFLATA